MGFKTIYKPFTYLIFLLGLLVVSSCSTDNIDDDSLLLLVSPVAFSEINSAIAFGQELSSGKKSPGIEYITNESNANVRAASAGNIVAIVLNDNEISDYEIHIRPTTESKWLIIYDHVLELVVSEGDQIQPGTILGKVGIANRTELQINKEDGANTISYCPLGYGADGFVEVHLDFMQNWCQMETVIP